MKYIFGSHHKSGTNFFLKFLRDISSEKELFLWDRGTQENARKEPDKWDIYFDHWSKWVIDLDLHEFKGMHVVRHPCSLIYSAALYHQASSEKWLHKPRSEFGGLTYAEKINSFENLEKKLIFEMENHSRSVIEHMVSVSKDKRFFNIKLEEISNDKEMKALRKGLEFLGLQGNELEVWLSAAKKHCLWNMSGLPKHSTTGVSEEWTMYFTGDILRRYREVFLYSEIDLGYEAVRDID